MTTIALDGLYSSHRNAALRRAETIVEQVHTLMDVFASQDDQPADIKRDQPGRVALCEHYADRHDHPRLERPVELMGNLAFDPSTYQSYEPKAWRSQPNQADFHAVSQEHRVDYTHKDGRSHYRVATRDQEQEVILDHARGTLTVL